MENGKPKGGQKTENAETREAAKISSFRLLPWVPVCFRGRLVSAVSLASELYPVYGIGKFGGRADIGKRGTERLQKHLETRVPGRKLKFLASVDFRLLPRPLGRGGFVSFGILSARRYWQIWWG